MVQATLESLNTVMGRSITTISIAHRLTTIKGSDIIYVLKDGRCCEQGSHDELMERQGEYYSMAKLQQAKGEENKDETRNEVVVPCPQAAKAWWGGVKTSTPKTKIAPCRHPQPVNLPSNTSSTFGQGSPAWTQRPHAPQRKSPLEVGKQQSMNFRRSSSALSFFEKALALDENGQAAPSSPVVNSVQSRDG